MIESTNREKDSSVTHAFSSFPGYYQPTDPKVAATIKTLNTLFCTTFQVNQDDDKKGIPGILYGRYQGDTYAGGNPWQLLTAVLGELFYQGANYQLEQAQSANDLLSADTISAWKELFPSLTEQSTVLDFAAAALTAGDAVLYRLYLHVKDDNGHINEQINKVTGLQMAAKDLTWSFANTMRAYHYRNKASALIESAKAKLEQESATQRIVSEAESIALD
jgi:glucoamylase